VFDKNPEDYKPDFVPTFKWTNASDIKLEMDSTGYQILRNGDIDVWGNRVKLIVPMANAVLFTGTGSFSAVFMDLHNFPFDTLDLPIELECLQNVGTAMFVPSFDIGSRVVDITESCIMMNPAFHTHQVLAEALTKECDGVKYSSFIARVKCERIWTAHSDIYMTTCSLSVCALAVFIQDYPDRIENLFVILLTLTAYSQVVQSEVPEVPYSTKIDIYIWACFFYMMLLLAETVVVSQLDEEVRDEKDLMSAYLFCAGFVLFNVGYIFVARVIKGEELKKISWYQKDFEKRQKTHDLSVAHCEFRFDQEQKLLLGAHWNTFTRDQDDCDSNDALVPY